MDNYKYWPKDTDTKLYFCMEGNFVYFTMIYTVNKMWPDVDMYDIVMSIENIYIDKIGNTDFLVIEKING